MSIARELVHKTPSESDSILIVTPDNRVLYASRGQYGGWIVKEQLSNVEGVRALWCFNREIRRVELSELEKFDEIKRFLEKVREYGLEEPGAEEVTYYYHPVRVEIKKTTDRYTVIDITPEDRTITAKAIRLKWIRHYSRKGNCSGVLCDEEDRQKLELIGKMLNVQVYTIPAPRRDFETIAKFVVDYSQVESYLKEEQQVEEAEVEAEEEKSEPQIEIKLPEVKPKELEVELVQTLPPQPAAVAQPQKAELVKVYLLSMRLPSKYLLQKVEVKENEEIRKWEGLAAQVASRLEGIRREAYERVSRIFAHVEEYGTWIAVSDEAVKEAQKLSEWIREELKKLPLNQLKNVDVDKLYSVKAIPVYLEPGDARELLNAAIAHLSSDVEELANKIREAEEQRKKSALKRLEADLQYKKALLEAFKKYLASI